MAHPPFINDYTTPTYVSFSTIYSSYCVPYYVPPKVETKKEKSDRVSREIMLSSWKIYNQQTPNIIKIKQICKPQHRISNRTFRGLK